MPDKKFIKLKNFPRYTTDQMLERSKEFLLNLQKRRTVRDYADEEVPIEIIINCIKAAAAAPSGANKQPWFFAVVKNPVIKKEIREAAEKEEKEFYSNNATEEWRKDLVHLGTDEHKPFLETAPYLIVIFEKKYDIDDKRNKTKNYYVKESVGIATGFLITALHNAGLATLTHTPSPMNFLNKILKRPENEKPYLILVTGFPSGNTKVPDIKKKQFDEICKII